MANKNLLAPGQAHDQSLDINKMAPKHLLWINKNILTFMILKTSIILYYI